MSKLGANLDTPGHQVSRFIPVESPDSSFGKESACNAGDLDVIPWLGRSPGEGKGYPLLCSGCIVHGVTKSRTQLSDFHFESPGTHSLSGSWASPDRKLPYLVLRSRRESRLLPWSSVQTGLSGLAIWNGRFYLLTPDSSSPIQECPRRQRDKRPSRGPGGREGTG